MYRVVLANTSFGITAGSVIVCGHSRRNLGYSRYSNDFGCHILEMTPAEYEAAAIDLSRNWHRARGKWIPHFVDVQEPAKVIEAQDHPQLRDLMRNSAQKLSDEDLIKILADRGNVRAAAILHGEIPVVTDTDPARGETIAIPSLAEVGLPTKFFALTAIARKEGVDLTGLKGAEAVKNAILAHRTQKAA